MATPEKSSTPEEKPRSLLEKIGLFALVAAGVGLLLGSHVILRPRRPR